jgi:hypothetical protein
VEREWRVLDIENARDIERRVLLHARRHGAAVKDPEVQGAMPQGGYTEVTTLPVQYLANLIDSMVVKPPTVPTQLTRMPYTPTPYMWEKKSPFERRDDVIVRILIGLIGLLILAAMISQNTQ